MNSRFNQFGPKSSLVLLYKANLLILPAHMNSQAVNLCKQQLNHIKTSLVSNSTWNPCKKNLVNFISFFFFFSKSILKVISSNKILQLQIQIYHQTSHTGILMILEILMNVLLSIMILV